MEKVKYRLSTISSLIVSPRSNLAWYQELKEFTSNEVPQNDYLKKAGLSIIYPFYQYGEYEKWSDSADYYLPGSSVKGVLCEKYDRRDSVMVDDLQIPNECIVLRNLYKVQDLETPNIAGLKEFFKNVGVEMVKAKTDLYGELYIREARDIKLLFNQANDVAKIRMRQMLEYLFMLYQRNYKKDLKDILNGAIEKLETLVQDNDVILLGGYKGLLHSMKVNLPLDREEKYGALFLDPETGLLHGLTRIQVLK